MQVSAENIFVPGSFTTILAIVAPAGENFTERFGLWPKVSATTMVLIAYQRLSSSVIKIAFQCHVRHEACSAALGIEINQPYALEFRSLKRFVVMAQQLISCTNAQKDGIRISRLL